MRRIIICGMAVVLGLATASTASAQSGAPQIPSTGVILPLLKPDLRILKMVAAGSTVRVLVANTGLAHSVKGCWLRVWDVKGGKLVGVRWAFIPPMAKGTSLWRSVTFSAPLAHSTVFARVDYFNVISEMSELNNGAVKVVP